MDLGYALGTPAHSITLYSGVGLSAFFYWKVLELPVIKKNENQPTPIRMPIPLPQGQGYSYSS